LFIKSIIAAKLVDFQLQVGQVTKIIHFSFEHNSFILSQSHRFSKVGIFFGINLKAILYQFTSK
jgi:hypothetical protein